jgi:hypothetical protein
LDAKHDTVDGSSNKVLSTTAKKKAGMGQEGGRHSPLKGEWTHLVRIHMPRIWFLILEHQF